MTLTVCSDHPLIAHKMSVLRDASTTSQDFRRVLREITFYLGYEATRALKTADVQITTPLATTTGAKLSEHIAIIPVLRSGLGMTEAFLDLLPKAVVHHIGMYRSHTSRLPVQYYNRLPKNEVCDVAFILDPCIATAETLLAVCSIVRDWGAKRIVVVAALGSRPGVDKLLASNPSVEVFIGAVDETLSREGMILPGLGDAGDRLFGTPFEATSGQSDDHLASNKKHKLDG